MKMSWPVCYYILLARRRRLWSFNFYWCYC
nr:MAG TPA: hypothetical protein [Caudoviricetes sp.]